MKGKRTYVAIVIGLIYLLGVWLGLWPRNEQISAAIILLALWFLRSALSEANGTSSVAAGGDARAPGRVPAFALLLFSLSPFLPGAANAADWKPYQPDTLGLGAFAYASSSDLKEFETGAGARVQYDFSRKFSGTLDFSGRDFHGTLIERGAASLAYGIPLGAFRPSAVSGLNYDLRNGNAGAHAGVRLEWQPLRHLRLGVDALARKTLHDPRTEALFQGGVTFTF